MWTVSLETGHHVTEMERMGASLMRQAGALLSELAQRQRIVVSDTLRVDRLAAAGRASPDGWPGKTERSSVGMASRQGGRAGGRGRSRGLGPFYVVPSRGAASGTTPSQTR